MKKSVAISVPNYRQQPDSPKMIFGFGICPVTLEPTILKINYPLYTDGPCLLFNIPHPACHFLKLLRFSNDNQPIVEAEIVQQWYRLLQVFHPIIDGFMNIGVEANHYIAMVKMAPYEAFACRCGKGDVVLRESYHPNTRGKLYYACPQSKPKENDYGQPSSPNSYSSGTKTPQNHHSGTSISGGCSSCKDLLGKIKVLEATVEMHLHLEQHTRNSTALLHELYNDMDNLGLE
ncbi:hypothetical protein Tco_0707537 [Tanacetum coccineum]|uniref:Uncharacterized protein n=1 Tax=Tanacetum coccineum TaxID=301880 RepID=A0ABQ4YAP0_9ASTR